MPAKVVEDFVDAGPAVDVSTGVAVVPATVVASDEITVLFAVDPAVVVDSNADVVPTDAVVVLPSVLATGVVTVLAAAVCVPAAVDAEPDDDCTLAVVVLPSVVDAAVLWTEDGDVLSEDAVAGVVVSLVTDAVAAVDIV